MPGRYVFRPVKEKFSGGWHLTAVQSLRVGGGPAERSRSRPFQPVEEVQAGQGTVLRGRSGPARAP